MEVRRKYDLIKPVTPEQLYGFIKQMGQGELCTGIRCADCPLHKEVTYLSTTVQLCNHLEDLGALLTDLEK